MGWYDDEEDTWMPDWSVKPMMWLGCLIVAVVPAGVGVAAVKLIWPETSTVANLGAYIISLGLMLAAVKPWNAQ